MKKITFASLMIFSLAILAAAQTVAMNDKKMDDKLPAKADPAAYNLLKDARSTRATFPTNFGGFSANIVFNDNGKVHRGTLDYTPKVELVFEMKSLTGEPAKKLEGDLSSLITHRGGGDFARGDGKYPITFGADDKDPLGRLLLLNDEMRSSYRISRNQVVQVNRTFGGETILINILETTQTENGRFLPRQFVVTFIDPETKTIKRTQAFSDTYEKVGGVWMPKTRRVITTENGVASAQIITFENFKMKTPRSASQ